MQYSVSVRTLCEFTAKRGDLDVRFTPSPSALEGMAGHQLVASRRGEFYETEISLRGDYESLTVRGRADGFDAENGQLEEIKTRRGDLSLQPANHRHLHWAQVKIYGWLLCEERSLAKVKLALVYFDVVTQEETVFVETHDAASLREFFEASCAEFLHWAKAEMLHREQRDAELSTLSFPYPSFRTGQRELAEAVFRGASSGRSVLAQAPTGIGKTMATTFAMLKAAPAQGLDKIFYLTAKSTGRRMALDAATTLRERATSLRIVEITAREKLCEHPDKACHGDSCPLARGFYDRLAAARADAIEAGVLEAAKLREVAQRHAVCPYYLSQELARWADMVVGDYNYWFDRSAMLYAMAVGEELRVGVLGDEAHNLVERARTMYSATLSQKSLQLARSLAGTDARAALEKVDRAWRYVRDASEANETADALEELPLPFVNALKGAAQVIEAQLSAAAAAPGAAPLQQAYFDILGFLRLLDSFGSHSVLEVAEEASDGRRASTSVRVQNLVPAPFLKLRFAAARSVTLFSATLTPPRYSLDMLGMPEDTAWIDVASPFAPEQLQVRVVHGISTRFPDRQQSAQPIADLIASQYIAKPGNYLAFFSSFDYLDMVAEAFANTHAAIPSWNQVRSMNEKSRNDFIARFQPSGAGIGFAVLGGNFGEGIDLRGDRLVGAFVATLGLPQINSRNERLKATLEETFGAGYDYAYLFPGLHKVVQAAGRVIRTKDDRGIVYLIDDRFRQPAIRKLLPEWWQISPTSA